MNAALMTMCVAGSLGIGQPDNTVFRSKQIEVRRHEAFGGGQPRPFHQLISTRIAVGNNFLKPEKRSDYGDPEKDFSRLPTTYYHPQSPVGMALKKFDWFPGRPNTYASDARLPASLIGFGGDPLSQLVDLWSEPPIAVLGLEVGTLAAYARPAQTMHITERMPTLVKLSLPEKNETRYFHYVQDALDRGAAVRIFDGEPRATLEKHGGERFYSLIVVECYIDGDHSIPKELLTREGMEVLMSKLTEDGILCYHTSNRYFDLRRVTASVAQDLKLAHLVGFDMADRRETSAYTSEWVMVAREKEHLAHLKTPEGYKEMVKHRGAKEYWQIAKDTDPRLVWTDKGEKSFRGVYHMDPDIARLSDYVHDIEDLLSRHVSGNAFRYTRPIHSAILRWSESSAQAKNREPVKDKKK
jgi:hypothetical protein